MNFYTRQSNKSSASGSGADLAGAAENLYRKSRQDNCFFDDEEEDIESGENEDNFDNSSSHFCHHNQKPHCCSQQPFCCPPQQPFCCPPQQPFCCPPQQFCCPPQQFCCPPQQFCCPPQPQCCCVPGPRGKRGPRGRQGEPSRGTIIPFASGNTPVTITTVANGLPSTGLVAAIGFGETQNAIGLGAGGGFVPTNGNMAFSAPRDLKITAITAYFTNILPNSVGASVLQISAQLYYSAQPNNVFVPLAGTRVNLTPTFTGDLAANNIFTGSLENIKVQVAQGTRLVLVFSLSIIGGPTLNTTLIGNASAGINII
ncbi:MAG: hypothetical protein CVU97_01295 [Firmicutes bacterium HGW-Firmicutes-21]|nr:MAG: hypothetical protein CVU97_01295 [Firmicutes bacterium HGW-Firmicutes-21]